MTAPATPAASTAASGTWPCQARTPPRTSATSPGKTKPTNAEDSSAGSAKTASTASQIGSDSRYWPIAAVIGGPRRATFAWSPR